MTSSKKSFLKLKHSTMKAITFLCFLFSLPLSIQAQAILEHTYPTTDLHRVHWTSGGEHYWFSDDSLKHIKVYSAGHQLEKTIRYPSVLNSQVRLLKSEQAVTQTHLNGDDLLEMIWIFKDTVTKKEPYKLQIRNEHDSIIFTVNTLAHLVYFSEIEGLPTKLLIATYENGYKTTVYNVPNIRIDTVYSNAYYLRRKKFGYAGEKYFYINNDSMKMYNANHTPWKKPINLKWSRNIQVCNFDPDADADDNVFLTDSLIKVVFSYWSGNTPRYGIIQEGNNDPFYKSSYPFRIDNQKGLSNKLFTRIRQSDNDYYRIYALPRFTIQSRSSYPVPLGRALLKKYGEVIIRFYTNQLTLSYNNPMGTKTISFPTNIIYPQSIFPNDYSPIISDSIVNKDTLVDVIYATYDYINNNKIYTTRIINEKGLVYNRIDSTRSFSLNQSPTLSPKLITKTGNDKPYDTKVWRFNTTTPTKEAPSVLEAKIYPNPFSKSITIETQENTVFPLKIRLINALGEVVLATKTNESKTDLALPNLPKGVYFLELTTENKRTVREIVKMD